MLQLRRKNGDPILAQDGLIEGEEVIVPSLGGYATATPKKDRFGFWSCENEKFLYTLKFDQTDGWICNAVINRRAIDKLRLEG